MARLRRGDPIILSVSIGITTYRNAFCPTGLLDARAVYTRPIGGLFNDLEYYSYYMIIILMLLMQTQFYI
jgi:hypothetical protein